MATRERGVTWVPGEGVCCWAAIADQPCDAEATRIVYRFELVDSTPPTSGLQAVPVCDAHPTSEHLATSREWTVVDDHQTWVELEEEWYARVWLVVPTSGLR
jgi:hypothetical protein